MRICAWMVVKNDAFYVDVAIKSVLPYVDGVYVQDQSSTDGTSEIIQSLKALYPDKIHHDIVDTGENVRFTNAYNEPYWRTEAIKRATEVFDPEFLLKLDADEMYTEHFFRSLEGIRGSLMDGNINGLMLSGDRFISKTHRAACSDDAKRDRFNNIYYDPHILFWSCRVNVSYVRNPAFPNSFLHCVLRPEPAPVHWVPGICVLHLHRTFGPKAKIFWEEGGEKLPDSPPYNPKEQAPNWYNHRVNMGAAQKVDFDWPDYALEKWKEWGEWED